MCFVFLLVFSKSTLKCEVPLMAALIVNALVPVVSVLGEREAEEVWDNRMCGENSTKNEHCSNLNTVVIS